MKPLAPGPPSRQQLGRLGEAAAEETLRGLGWTVLARRHRRRMGEIDLVAEDGELLVFVEVKTRCGSGYGEPAAAVTRLKRRRLARVAQDFLWRRGWLERPCRFDVVEVFASGSKIERVHHIVDAFRLWPTG